MKCTMTVWSVTKNLPTIDDNWIPYFEKKKNHIGYLFLLSIIGLMIISVFYGKTQTIGCNWCWPFLFENLILFCGKLFNKYYIDDYNLI